MVWQMDVLSSNGMAACRCRCCNRYSRKSKNDIDIDIMKDKTRTIDSETQQDKRGKSRSIEDGINRYMLRYFESE